MIICCCHGVSDRAYAEACRRALDEGRIVEDYSPAGTCCGGCLGTLREIRARIEAERGGVHVPCRCALALLPTTPHNARSTRPSGRSSS